MTTQKYVYLTVKSTCLVRTTSISIDLQTLKPEQFSETPRPRFASFYCNTKDRAGLRHLWPPRPNILVDPMRAGVLLYGDYIRYD